mgnify:FL=1
MLYNYSPVFVKFKDKYFIYALTLKLSKIENKNIAYKILQDYFKKNKIEVKNSKDISDAVSFIRRSKLPDPAVIANAGSFFKNVFVDKERLQKLLQQYPDMSYFEDTGDAKNGSKASVLVKISAAWLIEQCGWKGKKLGRVGVHDKQALVLVNYGGANGEEIINLANKIITDVKEKFGLELAPEVNLI